MLLVNRLRSTHCSVLFKESLIPLELIDCEQNKLILITHLYLLPVFSATKRYFMVFAIFFNIFGHWWPCLLSGFCLLLCVLAYKKLTDKQRDQSLTHSNTVTLEPRYLRKTQEDNKAEDKLKKKKDKS